MTLVLGPALATAVGLLLVVTDGLLATPPACAAELSANRCEETTFGLIGGARRGVRRALGAALDRAVVA